MRNFCGISDPETSCKMIFFTDFDAAEREPSSAGPYLRPLPCPDTLFTAQEVVRKAPPRAFKIPSLARCSHDAWRDQQCYIRVKVGCVEEYFMQPFILPLRELLA